MDSILEIDLDGIIDCIKEYKRRLSKKQKFCAVVKADCYGLGSRKICKAIDLYVDYFAVASRGEFFYIRKFVTKPILLLDPIYKNITILAKKGCEFCVSNLFQLKQIERFAKRNKDIIYKIHIAINTGMNRFGFLGFCELDNLLNIIQKTQNIKICGVFSHFYCGNNKILSKNQIFKLERIKKFLSSKIDISNIIFHISNTSGFENCRGFDMVRIGLGMFLKHNKQNISLKSKIVELQNLKPNQTAGYGLGFVAKSQTKIAVVSIGYADGIFRSISGKGYVLVNGEFAKILSVCMDSIIIDVTGMDVKLCDTVTIFGTNGTNQIFVCDIASWCDTIEYEIIARLSKRIKRVYIGGNINANNNREI